MILTHYGDVVILYPHHTIATFHLFRFRMYMTLLDFRYHRCMSRQKLHHAISRRELKPFHVALILYSCWCNYL